ncbi:MAG: aminoglycoside phosphotransferase family protein [Candidatus Thorarchaeota archaeon]
MKDSPSTNKHAGELQEELSKRGIIPDNSIIDIYSQVHGGADNTIFEIGFQNHHRRYIQRIYRPNIAKESAEFEYTIQKTLFENGISVPEPFLLKFTPNTLDRMYFVMQKIEGQGLNVVMKSNPQQIAKLIERFLYELHQIHSIDPNLFPQIPRLDIETNPYAVIDQTLRGTKAALEKYPKDLVELGFLVDWLEEKKTDNPCRELVVIHGDYHPYNTIVDENNQLQILDWTGVNISDFRRDLGFATTVLSSGIGKNHASDFARFYGGLSEKKVENLEYFMVLSSVWNILRWYSGINNPSITNESNDTMNFFKSVREYPLLMVELVRKESGIDLKQIEQYFC